jgi:hypothetical protein
MYLAESSILTMSDLDFAFKNTSTNIIVLKNLRLLKIGSITIGPLKEGEEIETKNWIASELIKKGYARDNDEYSVNVISLNKIHWRETRLQTGRRISSLPEYFYPRLRRYLHSLKENAISDASFAIEYDRSIRLAHDIVNCRLKKIVSLAAAPSQTENILRALAREERILYNVLHTKISKWKIDIFKVEVF